MTHTIIDHVILSPHLLTQSICDMLSNRNLWIPDYMRKTKLDKQ